MDRAFTLHFVPPYPVRNTWTGTYLAREHMYVRIPLALSEKSKFANNMEWNAGKRIGSPLQNPGVVGPSMGPAGTVISHTSALTSAPLTTVAAVAPSVVAQNNFEGLLPRSPYIPEPSIVPLSCSTPVTSCPPPMQPQLTTQVSTSPSMVVVGSRVNPPPAAHQGRRHSEHAFFLTLSDICDVICGHVIGRFSSVD